MCLFGFLCFNGVCGFRVFRFLIDYMFQGYVSMFMCQGHFQKYGNVSRHGYIFVSRPCFSMHVSISSACLCIKLIFHVKGMFQLIISCLY
jgi:hypothetical protein